MEKAQRCQLVNQIIQKEYHCCAHLEGRNFYTISMKNGNISSFCKMSICTRTDRKYIFYTITFYNVFINLFLHLYCFLFFFSFPHIFYKLDFQKWIISLNKEYFFTASENKTQTKMPQNQIGYSKS